MNVIIRVKFEIKASTKLDIFYIRKKKRLLIKLSFRSKICNRKFVPSGAQYRETEIFKS